MQAEELERAIEALGLKQSGEHGLDRFLGVTDKTVRNWLRLGAPPLAVAMLLRLMVDKKLSPQKVREKYGDD